jgi:hypothetical protein
VSSSEVAYSSSNGGVFGKLSCLSVPTSCGFATGTTAFVDTQIAAMTPKQGYARTLDEGTTVAGTPDTDGLATFLYASTPVTLAQTGNRGFAVDHSGLVCFTVDGTIPPNANAALTPACTPLR